MSGAGQSPAIPAPPGPYEAHVREIWDGVWKAEQDGGVFEPLIALAESHLAGFAANLPTGNPGAQSDLQLAQNWHLFQSRHFAAHLASLQTYREQIQDASHQIYDQMAKFNEHAVKSLTLAHGGIVIAALAYIQSKDAVPFGMVEVIALCSLGYLLTILGSHLVAALSAPITSILLTLKTPRTAEKVRMEAGKSLAKANRRMVWISRPVFYFSAICLIIALLIGVRSLINDRKGTPGSSTSKAHFQS